MQFALVLLLCFTIKAVSSANRSFVIDYDKNCFVKDGKGCYQYISGSIHYFRVPHQYWMDRLMKLRAAGFDAIQSYVSWNMHETEPGSYDFAGDKDLVQFIKIAQDLGLLVILRPGPYIDNDIDFGGLPWWLLKTKPQIKVRTSDSRFMNAVDRWMKVLLPKIRPFAYKNGGPIISVQVENEYGSYFACDHNYTIQLRDLFRRYLGDDVILFTVDGPDERMLSCGAIPKVYPTVDFGVTAKANVRRNFKLQMKYAHHGPNVCTEFYPGWQDRWGYKHNTVNASRIIRTLRSIWSFNGSVNMFMFHGGTNFGYWGGADEGRGGTYLPITTSFDFDAPLSEAGDPRPKYYIIRSAVEKHRGVPIPHPVPPPSPVITYGPIKLKRLGTILDLIDSISPGWIRSKYTLSFEELDCGFGFVLYISKLTFGGSRLLINSVHDRAYIIWNGKKVLAVGQRPQKMTVISSFAAGDYLHILVENQGRLSNFNRIDNRAGILSNVTIDAKPLTDWIMYPLSFEKYAQGMGRSRSFPNKPPSHFAHMNVCCPHHQNAIPALYSGDIDIELIADTYLDPSGWGKGQAFINGFNIGRYWPGMGPQVTLYVPKYYLKMPKTRILLVELEHPGNCEDTAMKTCYAKLIKRPIIDAPPKPVEYFNRSKY